ncbi:hypothetical protein B0O99DRAFT_684015 [Bisporella sp. PMI_857]|nr:hypothetical protein B0O99DRAFT_684015 [Bisporella sp. PMI_857]
MTTNTSKSANISMLGGAPAASIEPASFDKVMSEVTDEEGYCWSTPPSRSPVPEDQPSPATVHFMGRVQQRREPATNTDNETNDKHPHNVNRRNNSDERSAQHPGNRIAQENCRSATKPRAPTRSPTASSPNGNSSRRIPEVFTPPRTLGTMTSGASGPPTMQIVQATAQHPVAQTMDRGIQFNNMRRTATPRVSETTAQTNIQDREFSQHISLADSRIHDSIAVASLPPSAAHSPRIRRSARNSRPEISIEVAEERRTRSPTSTTIHQYATSHDKERENRSSANGTSPPRYQRCILEDSEKGKELIQLVRGFIEGNKDGADKKVLMDIHLVIEIGKFYDTNAYGPAERALSDDDLINILSPYSNEPASTILQHIVNAVDKAYFEAGWVLKPVLPSQHGSSSVLPTPSQKGKRTQTLSPPSKRSSRRSYTGTSRSGKRSRWQSTAQSFTSAPSESRTSISQSTRYRCYCGNTPLLRKWTEHDATHHPLHFFACIDGLCEHITSRWDVMIQHSRDKHDVNLQQNKELKKKQKQNKFLIRDRGHEKCIYKNCNAVFDGDGKRSREHIGWHLKQETFEALVQRLDHRCTDANCGGKSHWRSSVYVQPENRQRAEDDDTDESGGDGLSRNSRDGNVQVTDGAWSRGSSHGTSEHGGPVTTAGGASSAPPYSSPYQNRVWSADQQAAANDPIENYVQDETTYALESNRIPTHPSVAAARKQMRSTINQHLARFQDYEGM